MKKLLLLLAFLLTGCYTTYDWSYYTATRQPESLLAVTSHGDTVQVPTYQFYTNYQQRPTYYNDWRFYYRDTWYNPHSYYTTYYKYSWYRPFNTWNYTPYTYPTRIEPKRESKPRSSGTTSRTKTERSSEPRSTGRSAPTKRDDKPKKPQRRKRGGSVD